VRFGRKGRNEQSEEALDEVPTEDSVQGTAQDTAQASAPGPATGPYDASEIQDHDGRNCIDLGSLLVTPVGPM
jgi:hypothetical protein